MSTGTIKKVAGPLVIAEGMRDANMFDVVRVSSQRLIGEIIEIHGDDIGTWTWRAGRGYGSTNVSRTWSRTDHKHIRWNPETAG